MDAQAVMYLFAWILAYLLLYTLLVWLLRRRNTRPRVLQENDDADVEPGTLGNRPNYRAVALLDQVDALIHRMDEAEMDEVIEEMQRRGW